ncbi:helix-turn-helix domain-containing protein [Subdoligranulum sp. AF14-43]|nr:helix-turn-helix domain-containing protein [Subdoligranulum sp. AF14-43]
MRMEARRAIKELEKQGQGARAIARAIGCEPKTVTNELRRGTPTRKSTRGRTPGYSPRQGEAIYEANRTDCHRPSKAGRCSNFTDCVGTQI